MCFAQQCYTFVLRKRKHSEGLCRKHLLRGNMTLKTCPCSQAFSSSLIQVTMTSLFKMQKLRSSVKWHVTKGSFSCNPEQNCSFSFTTLRLSYHLVNITNFYFSTEANNFFFLYSIQSSSVSGKALQPPFFVIEVPTCLSCASC